MNTAPLESPLADVVKDGTLSLVETLRGYGLREGMGDTIEPLRRPSKLNEEDFNTFLEADGIVSK